MSVFTAFPSKLSGNENPMKHRVLRISVLVLPFLTLGAGLAVGRFLSLSQEDASGEGYHATPKDNLSPEGASYAGASAEVEGSADGLSASDSHETGTESDQSRSQPSVANRLLLADQSFEETSYSVALLSYERLVEELKGPAAASVWFAHRTESRDPHAVR